MKTLVFAVQQLDRMDLAGLAAETVVAQTHYAFVVVLDQMNLEPGRFATEHLVDFEVFAEMT